ncbi:Uu.00g122070.m01.CDS01 [Anthostomella pinea]|uniref:Uu.00g122070.m01.CDS01 n=1 Tax=Anthostomella pinea TaxID=933095 RepID=A0AAI8YEY8_9PEZI|nr:Uu.00g122070.m01.CDS01 [Anthostomella pinea]
MATSMYSAASLDDEDFATPMSPQLRPYGYPSARSGYGFSAAAHDPHDESDDNLDDASLSTGNYSPPAWRRLENGDRWYGNWRGSNDLLGRGFDKSRHLSPDYDDRMSPNDVFEEARRTRLPTGSLSPEKGRTPEPEALGKDDTLVNMKSENGMPTKSGADRAMVEDQRSMMASMPPEDARDNYIRFAVRADVQHRTEPIEAAVKFFRSRLQPVTNSWSSMILSTLVALISISAVRSLFEPASQRPVPDLVKVAGIARSFEPLIYYSENGVSQVGDLQATGVAVWDLGESVRSSNMTSAPIIVKSLDELSDSLKTLAIELTRFFANVDGDIDGILIVMDWARRELTQVQAVPSPPLSTAFANIHNMLCEAGVFENPATGTPTRLGAVATTVFGMSQPQRTRYTLQRTFTEFLSVLEEAIENELQHSLALFGLFEAIDRQFLNLARTVVRESSAQDEQHNDLLSSMWTRILGPKASEVKKYERNRELLLNVREKTVRNKGILVEHNGKLLTLKANLESLRRKLVSPLVRSVNSSTLTLEEQIKGLEDVGVYLEGVRARQKGKLMEMLYGRTGGGRAAISAGARIVEEDGRWAS